MQLTQHPVGKPLLLAVLNLLTGQNVADRFARHDGIGSRRIHCDGALSPVLTPASIRLAELHADGLEPHEHLGFPVATMAELQPDGVTRPGQPGAADTLTALFAHLGSNAPLCRGLLGTIVLLWRKRPDLHRTLVDAHVVPVLCELLATVANEGGCSVNTTRSASPTGAGSTMEDLSSRPSRSRTVDDPTPRSTRSPSPSAAYPTFKGPRISFSLSAHKALVLGAETLLMEVSEQFLAPMISQANKSLAGTQATCRLNCQHEFGCQHGLVW